MPRLLLILDDDRTRLRGFDEIVPRLGNEWVIRSWRDAPSMIAEIDRLLGGVQLISLDHDLYKDSPSDPDPGTGRMIADLLSKRAPVCPVIVHSTNTEAAWGMFNELRSGKWRVELVHHLNQAAWIADLWLPVAAKLALEHASRTDIEPRVADARNPVLFTCEGGIVMLPDAKLVFVDRSDGGHLIVNPPRAVWERSELTADELSRWSFLVAATGQAMLDSLPQLNGGCVNYFEAGNWALNDNASPKGRKKSRDHRSVHLHIFGRSPAATDPSWRWGEAPKFPDFKERHAWAASRKRLTEAECAEIMLRTADILRHRYGMHP